MKKTEWINGNKMKMESGHKTFDRQTNLVTTGNVVSNTQHSKYIRPVNLTKNPVGQAKPKQFLTDFDLDAFSDLPYFIRHYIYTVAVDESVILYEFRHFRGNKKVIDGYIVTTKNHDLMRSFLTGPTFKSKKVIDECVAYISKPKKALA